MEYKIHPSRTTIGIETRSAIIVCTFITTSDRIVQTLNIIECTTFAPKFNTLLENDFLNNIIAGPSMNTMLNIALREHNGLVYTVESSLTNYTDTGTFGLYFGCDNKDVERCMDIIWKEFDKLISTPLTQRQMQAALKQMKGQILVACDNFESYALDMAKSFLHYNIFEGIDDTLSQLSALTPELVQQTAKEMLADESLSALVYE